MYSPNTVNSKKNWHQSFPGDVQLESAALTKAADSHNETDEKRIDLTHLKTYAIDDETSFEIDDALSLEQSAHETTLWIHIADPCRLIRFSELLELEARKRVTSVYLVDKVIPMLPFDLTDSSISLKPFHRRAAISASVILNNDGSIDVLDFVLIINLILN